MSLRSRLFFVFASAATSALILVSSTQGCQSDSSGNSSQDDEDDDGTPSGTGAAPAGPGGGSNPSNSGPATTGSGAGGAPGDSCEAPDATIDQVTHGQYADDTLVNLKGVVAMSYKWLVYGPSGSGSCLWGVFVSDPGLTTTKPNSGVLVVGFGDNAVTNDAGKAYCPKLGVEPVGGTIPDDVKPGDVLDVNGKVSLYAPADCPAGTVKQYQVASNGTACPVKKTGTATPPAPAVIPADQVKLISSTDANFLGGWGGVKVRVENVDAAPVATPYASGCDSCCPSTTDPPCVVNAYGEIHLTEGNVAVQDATYYRGYLKYDSDTYKCNVGPLFDTPDVTKFAFIQGFTRLDYCTWSLEAHDKCGDFSPASQDCGGATSCPQLVLP